MRRIIIIFLIITLLFSLVACNKSDVNRDLIIDIEDSTKFTKEEVSEAIDLVVENFSFPASTLTKVSYDEETSNELVNVYIQYGKGSVNGVKPENVIVILTDFDVDDSGDNPVLNPSSTYTDYQWILIRDSKTSDWIIDDWGY